MRIRVGCDRALNMVIGWLLLLLIRDKLPPADVVEVVEKAKDICGLGC